MRQIAGGVDGSSGSLAAVDWAAEEAASRGAGLQLVNASLWPEHQVVAVRESRDVRTERAKALLVDAAGRAGHAPRLRDPGGAPSRRLPRGRRLPRLSGRRGRGVPRTPRQCGSSSPGAT
ncbi:universal stress protein [Streptomyces sp. PvR006]|uniref:universal stress protein n=1 Tax=Streptomyces sp. PvR006 TaxID=2817860 RepID=UPI0024790793|nr:universal stress protein [Streptomyces sp. PvR006]